MPFQERAMTRGAPAEADGTGQVELLQNSGGNGLGEAGGSYLVKGEESLVEKGVEVCGEEQSVENVQPLLVGATSGPGFGMAGAEQFGNPDSGDCAGTIPILQQGLTEAVLAARRSSRPRLAPSTTTNAAPPR